MVIYVPRIAINNIFILEDQNMIYILAYCWKRLAINPRIGLNYKSFSALCLVKSALSPT